MAISVGIGYDSHRFADDRRLILGGVEVPHEMGLSGHSDADVLTHAIIDAVLGAAGLGDIGEVFPDTDPAWEGADSISLLSTVIGMLRGPITNVDATLICEQPKLGPHRPAMVARLSEITGSRVSVKATTNEQMGWIGRGEGIACMAVAAVNLD
ncbi:MAG TPA: 2-C-methyl-D-erythritol 2,4-cyclodiphosphate synthase [Solirubrobacterales bacterium]|jgi:2-C-methyl-D-erythritol 2,4-cyclodiphosphate synthase|nr:2-C-methyl-D-erythritol 2,4-cyclodiphosphate synthase [Solirubrobacterales bacterium]HMU26746.1 2-C-methyl-D-erythritol 2,4-cyclodiphosphate synthase [Solirubrobacterales bacterium]HMW44474.1 2-C-methyl-D-erythritol 2,4-cyclodiphosphate synthase [Solirubrobacterales bacterium]HMX70319.1 2-C-methyl-D-erythritol 2,4-cyclodiphosphate synthase [Solirubrobacterales bacterium]HMY24946.1 2-C-methyl-D-erythritol 2,4-cyclodiphosphate synthase [Solirubrobacterales bacterium]